mmetsp:Transcript_34350/g.75138  ORF Transcript_34350/g.75138 Transcript_34350/m.75138 type:complete len:214 (-) Transcript_34350:5-646(-)
MSFFSAMIEVRACDTLLLCRRCFLCRSSSRASSSACSFGKSTTCTGPFSGEEHTSLAPATFKPALLTLASGMFASRLRSQTLFTTLHLTPLRSNTSGALYLENAQAVRNPRLHIVTSSSMGTQGVELRPFAIMIGIKGPTTGIAGVLSLSTVRRARPAFQVLNTASSTPKQRCRKLPLALKDGNKLRFSHGIYFILMAQGKARLSTLFLQFVG